MLKFRMFVKRNNENTKWTKWKIQVQGKIIIQKNQKIQKPSLTFTKYCE